MPAMAFVFPGQNSHHVGMARELWEAGGAARAILERANAILGWSLTSLMFEGPEQVLTATENQQPAILAHSVASLVFLRERGFTPRVVAGHSLGEYSALVAAECLDFETALTLVRRRGEYMAAAGGGAMAAVIGLDPAQVEAICGLAQEVGYVGIANYNCPGQVVITGEPDAIREAERLLNEAGAARIIRLRVSGAFHSPLMQRAAEALASDLDTAPLAEARTPVVSNVDAELRTSAAEIRAALKRQITSPVLWEQSVRRMVAEGVSTFVEVGPGKVLSGLIRRTIENVRTVAAGTPEEIEKLTS